MKVPGDQQRQANDAKVQAFGFDVSPLGQFASVVGREQGIEVGRVLKESLQVDIQSFHRPPRYIVFNLGKNRFVKIAHRVPKALSPQGCGAEGQHNPAKIVCRYQDACLRLLVGASAQFRIAISIYLNVAKNGYRMNIL